MMNYGEYNSRQYEQMLELISQYEQRRLPFEKVVKNLYALIQILKEVPDEWRNQLYAAWSGLDDTWADLAARGMTAPGAEYTKYVEQDLEAFKSLVLKALRH